MKIQSIIKKGFLESYLHPIVCIGSKKIFGFEALLRPSKNSPLSLPTHELFSLAKKEQCSIMLDNHARDMALTKFKAYFDKDNSLILFLNFEIESLISNDMYSFVDKAKKLDIPLSNILIEVKEDLCTADGELHDRIMELKELGALICIDDFGVGYSNFDRLNLIRPDLIKLDKSIINGIHTNYVNSEIVSMITKMANKLGTEVLAEGVEDHHDIIKCMEIGIGLFQGFYFSKPVSQITKNTTFLINDKIQTVDKSFTHISKTYRDAKKKLLTQANLIAKQSIVLLNTILTKNTLQQKIQELVDGNKNIESIYFINYESGLQVGEVFSSFQNTQPMRRFGDKHNHNAKEHYLNLYNSPQMKYLSEPFISKLSGEVCRTFALKIKRKSLSYIVCLDIVISDCSFF